jgi:hypothetical protein
VEWWVHVCESKRIYDSFEQAHAHALLLNTGVTPYICSVCELVHLGHGPDSPTSERHRRGGSLRELRTETQRSSLEHQSKSGD